MTDAPNWGAVERDYLVGYEDRTGQAARGLVKRLFAGQRLGVENRWFHLPLAVAVARDGGLALAPIKELPSAERDAVALLHDVITRGGAAHP